MNDLECGSTIPYRDFKQLTGRKQLEYLLGCVDILKKERKRQKEFEKQQKIAKLAAEM